MKPETTCSPLALFALALLPVLPPQDPTSAGGRGLLPPGPVLTFSLDIGSDCEWSDPFADLDEVFDPGDMIIEGVGLFLDFDDALHFGFDPFPAAPAAAPYGAACPGGGPGIPGQYNQVFDLDGFDRVNLPLGTLLPGRLSRSYLMSLNPAYARGIHEARFVYVSFDDDVATGYLCSPSMPVDSSSPAGATYGRAGVRDEVVRLHLVPGALPYTIASQGGVRAERQLHNLLAPNPGPAFGPVADDDVDALDAPLDGTRALFSADVEGNHLLYAGVVYEAGLGVPVILTSDLGLSPPLDIDAFELAWVRDDPADPTSPMMLALLFSVDDDDPLTGGDESHGLDPRSIYLSYLDGGPPQVLVTLRDDVDAIAVARR